MSPHHRNIRGGVCLIKLKVLGLKVISKLVFSWKFIEVHRVIISQKNLQTKGFKFYQPITTPVNTR